MWTMITAQMIGYWIYSTRMPFELQNILIFDDMEIVIWQNGKFRLLLFANHLLRHCNLINKVDTENTKYAE